MHKVVQRTDDLAASLLDLNRSHLLPNTPGSRPANAVLFMHIIAGTAPARRGQAEHRPRLPGRRRVHGLTPTDQLAGLRGRGWRLVSRVEGAVWCGQQGAGRDGERECRGGQQGHGEGRHPAGGAGGAGPVQQAADALPRGCPGSAEGRAGTGDVARTSRARASGSRCCRAAESSAAISTRPPNRGRPRWPGTGCRGRRRAVSGPA